MLYGVYGVFQHDVFSGKETLAAQLALFPLFASLLRIHSCRFAIFLFFVYYTRLGVDSVTHTSRTIQKNYQMTNWIVMPS